MWLVICHTYDEPAIWTYRELRERGLTPLVLVTDAMLLSATRCVHCVSSAAESVYFELPDGRVVDGESVRGVVNRLISAPVGDEAMLQECDREYTVHERTAFFLSWLNVLHGPILNPPTPQGLSGRWRHASEWVVLANEAGLPTARFRSDSRQLADSEALHAETTQAVAPRAGETTIDVLVVGEHVLSSVPLDGDVRSACVRLSGLAETPLLGVHLLADADGDGHVFAGATPFPDVRPRGRAFIDTLIAELVNGN